MERDKEESPEQLIEWAKRKKQKQHEAWKRWYHSPLGAAYRQRQKEKKALAK